MATKLYDLIVPVSKYTDSNGQDADSSGSTYKFAMLKRTFNPAGVEAREGSDAIKVTMTPPKPKQQGQQTQAQTQYQQQTQQQGYSAQQWGQPDGFGESVNDMPF